MKMLPVILLAVVTAAGCASSPPAQPTEVPSVASRDYDVLWEATRDVVQTHFELFVQRKDAGYMLSTYKRGDPIPGGGLKRDAQNSYDATEELLHVVRRQLTARIIEDYPGVYVVHLEIIRERQGYTPPAADLNYADFDLYDREKTSLRPAADEGPTVTWYRLGRDVFLEKALLERIQKNVENRKAAVHVAPVAVSPSPAGSPAVAPPTDNSPAPPGKVVSPATPLP